MRNIFAERKGEWIPSLDFRRRLSISRPVYLEALKDGRIKHEVHDGKEFIEFISNRQKFIETSNDPMRYTEEAIAKRHKQKLERWARKAEVKTAQIRQKKGLPPLDRHREIGIVDDVGNINKVVIPPSSREGLADGMNVDSLIEPSDAEFHPAMARRESEAVKQLYLAKQAKLKFFKDAGVLMETAKIKEEWEAIAISVQKTMLAIPDRVSELYASMLSADEIRKNLTKEITNSLTNLKFDIDKSNGKKIQDKEEV